MEFIVDFYWRVRNQCGSTTGVKTDLLQINHKTTFEAVCVTQSFAFLMHAKCIIVVYCSSCCCCYAFSIPSAFKPITSLIFE